MKRRDEVTGCSDGIRFQDGLDKSRLDRLTLVKSFFSKIP